MREDLQMEQRIARLEAKQRVLRLTCFLEAIVFVTLVAGTFLMGHVHANSAPEILHVRGLVIEDAEGRPRALLGAPFPKVLRRKRQDEGSNALVFLNEDGSDRLLVGEGIDSQIEGKVYAKEKRAMVGSAYGVSIMDGSGNERGGFGFTATSAGRGRAVIALDRPVGDAWGAWVDDQSGWAGMTFNYPMPFKQYQPGIEMGLLGEKPFLHFKDKDDNARAELSVEKDGTPSFAISDVNGRQIGDLLQGLKK